MVFHRGDFLGFVFVRNHLPKFHLDTYFAGQGFSEWVKNNSLYLKITKFITHLAGVNFSSFLNEMALCKSTYHRPCHRPLTTDNRLICTDQ